MNKSALPPLRAWDLACKVMHHEFEGMYIHSGDEENAPSGLIYNSDIYRHDWAVWPPTREYDVKLLIMEYTKVKDKNEKDIFGLDFVKVVKEEQSWIGIVQFLPSGCPAVCDVEDYSSDGRYSYFSDKKATFEIVGNYFENSELRGKVDIDKYN